jgi:hypothetical protein
MHMSKRGSWLLALVSISSACGQTTRVDAPETSAIVDSLIRPFSGTRGRSGHAAPIPETIYPNTPSPPQCNGTCSMAYYGGPIIPNVKIYSVLWTANVAMNVKTGIAGFYDAVTNNAFMDWANEYNTTLNANAGSHTGQAGTQQLVGRGVYAGQFTITPKVVTGNKINDTQIGTELDAQIAAGALPVPDANTIYFLAFPQGHTITLGTQKSCQIFCAYHNTYVAAGSGVHVKYAVMPDFQTDCATGCGTDSYFDNFCSTAAHELMEAVTDADVGLEPNGPNYDYPGAFGDNTNGEVGDMCGASNGTITSLFTGMTYNVQQIFSQTTGMCETFRQDARDFAVWAPNNKVTLQAGSSATVQIAIDTSTSAGAAQPLTLKVSGLPAGVTGTLGVASLTSGANTTLTFSAQNATGTSKDVVVVVEADGVTKHTAGILLQVLGCNTAADCNNGCLTGATCVSGACVGGTPVTCTPLDQCHVAGTCNPATGMCSNPAKADGLPCSTGNQCTSGETCTGGVCGGGSVKGCTAMDACHLAGTCNPANGACSNPNAPDGTLCPGGMCVTGVCVANPPDLSQPRDLSVTPDLSALPDLAVPPDLSVPRDFAVAPDLSTSPDLATSRDLASSSDLASSTDLATSSDLASSRDLASHDLAGRDLSSTGDAAVAGDASMRPDSAVMGGGGDAASGGGDAGGGNGGGGCGCVVGGSAPSDARGPTLLIALVLLAFALRRLKRET